MRVTEISDLCNGDEVYFKRNGEQRWHGPGTVIGRDGKQVLVRHGGVYIRAHICRLAKFPSSLRLVVLRLVVNHWLGLREHRGI